MHYLMIKKSLETGLMYLCKTSNPTRNPYHYTGSGVRWLNHIRKHKPHIITCIIGEYETKEELIEQGIYYSKLFNVVNDPNWANLTEEKGDGGLIGNGQTGKHWKIKDTSKMKKPKTQTKKSFAGYKKITGKNNYQFEGLIQTPWGLFESKDAAVVAAKELKKKGNTKTISDGGTLRKYIENLDVPLNSEGRRTPKEWRGKTPKEIGFNLIKEIK